MLELCSATRMQSRVIRLWAALLGQEVPYCFTDSGEPQQGLSFEELSLLFLKLLFMKSSSQAIWTLSLMYPIKDRVLFLLQKSLWTSHCALQIKTIGILAVQSCRSSRGAQGTQGMTPSHLWLEMRESCKATTVLQGVDGECDPAISSHGGRKRSLNFLPLSSYFVPAQ